MWLTVLATGWRGMYFLPMTTGVRNVASPSFGPEPIIGRLLQIVLTTLVVQDGGMVSCGCRCLLIIYRGTFILLCGVSIISVVELSVIYVYNVNYSIFLLQISLYIYIYSFLLWTLVSYMCNVNYIYV
jgi:hypothetical protein